MTEHSTDQKIALITGANKGIGRAAAQQLAVLGMTVLIRAETSGAVRRRLRRRARRAGDAHPPSGVW